MTNNESRKELLTAEDVAQLLNIKKRTLLRWARDGKIERVRISPKVILFRDEAIEGFVKSRTIVVKSETTNYQRAGRKTDSTKTRKGGERTKSRESWRSLRQEVATWQ
jgi:excisionase family DNA binding protein